MYILFHEFSVSTLCRRVASRWVALLQSKSDAMYVTAVATSALATVIVSSALFVGVRSSPRASVFRHATRGTVCNGTPPARKSEIAGLFEVHRRIVCLVVLLL